MSPPQFSSNRESLYVAHHSKKGTLILSHTINHTAAVLIRDLSSLPPFPVMQSTIDTFFTHVHNQPYSFFQEASFRLKLDSNILPRCLVLAVLASAVRFSTHEFYAGKTQEATEIYARESWLTVLSDHLTVEENMSLSVVQTMNMLAVTDYTGMVNTDSDPKSRLSSLADISSSTQLVVLAPGG